jgi:hypothetical protein
MNDMATNNFKELEREVLAEIGPVPSEIGKKIAYHLGVFRFFGDMVELYVPHMGQSILRLAGADPKPKPNSETTAQQPS